jgi:peptidyl-prolyl cis-trans isomerase SurA
MPKSPLPFNRIKLCACVLSVLLACSATGYAQTSLGDDFIVALVNSEPITNAELENQIRQVIEGRSPQSAPLPPAAELRAAILERMIVERAQLQMARETGVRIDPAQIDQAEANIAAQNQMDLVQLRANLERRGTTRAAFRQQLRDQIIINRLQERELESRIKISDTDVEVALAARSEAAKDPQNQEINLGHLFLSLPENPSADAVQQAQQKAQIISSRLKSGDSFESLVQEYSSAERSNAGQLGLRRTDRYPPLFINASQSLEVGGVSQWLRSDAGLHLLKVLDRRVNGLSDTQVQHHARHILLRPDASFTQEQAIQKLGEVREQILKGATSFEAQARTLSQDSSAAQGGDLGWASPGLFVPEFEQVLVRLNEKEIAEPLVSRFGVHLIQLIARRNVALTPAQLRERERNLLRAKRADEAFDVWVRDVRGRAFVEIRDPG